MTFIIMCSWLDHLTHPTSQTLTDVFVIDSILTALMAVAWNLLSVQVTAHLTAYLTDLLLTS